MDLKDSAEWPAEDEVHEVSAPVAAQAEKPVASVQALAPSVTEGAGESQDTLADEKPVTNEASEQDGKAFPGSLRECWAMLDSLKAHKRLGANPTTEQVAAHNQFNALRKHIYELQQGLKPETRNIVGGTVGLNVTDETRWKYIARIDPVVKRLLDAYHEALRENIELKDLLDQAK